MGKFKNQKELFLHIWNSREHISEVSGKPLLPITHHQWHWQMAHILPKGSNPNFKLNPDNIMLMLPEEHANQERFEAFNERKLKLQQQYYKEYYGKEFI